MMTDHNNRDGSPMSSRRPFGIRGDGPAANWLTDSMRVLQNTPQAFQDTVTRAVEMELTDNLSFWQMMDTKATAISRRTRLEAAGNR